MKRNTFLSPPVLKLLLVAGAALGLSACSDDAGSEPGGAAGAVADPTAGATAVGAGAGGMDGSTAGSLTGAGAAGVSAAAGAGPAGAGAAGAAGASTDGMTGATGGIAGATGGMAGATGGTSGGGGAGTDAAGAAGADSAGAGAGGAETGGAGTDTAGTAGVGTAGTGGASTTDEDLDMTAEQFSCIGDWDQVLGFRITNLLGHLDEAMAVAESASGGTYPVGTILQHLPTEAMVKRSPGWSPETKDWEFFVLTLSAGGVTTIAQRGTTEVTTGMGDTCASCHIAVPDEFDFVCNTWAEQGGGNCGFDFTPSFLDMQLATDTRCQ